MMNKNVSTDILLTLVDKYMGIYRYMQFPCTNLFPITKKLLWLPLKYNYYRWPPLFKMYPFLRTRQRVHGEKYFIEHVELRLFLIPKQVRYNVHTLVTIWAMSLLFSHMKVKDQYHRLQLFTSPDIVAMCIYKNIMCTYHSCPNLKTIAVILRTKIRDYISNIWH